jgi:formate hydrogenlyase subunit 6/NADH:ubiquinone oxidoreductase subunit I
MGSDAPAATPYPIRVLDLPGLGALFDALRSAGRRLVGPTVRDGAIVYDEIASPSDLPRGWTDEQAPGRYRLARRQDGALFGYAVGPHSWKKELFAPFTKLWSAKRTEGGGMDVTAAPIEAPPTAFIGVRACELAAIAVQDRVFLQGTYVDPQYKARREAAFLVAVNCSTAGGTCFCVSMKTGPKASSSYDLALTELLEPSHAFLVECGTQRGADLLARVPSRPATGDDLTAAEAVVRRTAAQMGRTLDTDGLPALLQRNREHPRWDDVAARCLACTNCTMVCPTCFCSTTEDVPDLSLAHSDRVRRWDSCYTADFSYLHGGSVRATIRARYRHWMTHKLSTWHDQFGTSGCVGCGRCITWCPTGIDLTVESAAIRATDGLKLSALPAGKENLG